MRVTMLAMGSRGDVQPWLAMGVGLVRAGHSVALVTNQDHAALVRSYGLELHSVPIDLQAALQAPGLSGALEGGGLLHSFRELAKLAERAARASAEVGLAAARGSDLIVAGVTGAFLAEGLARAVGAPLVQTFNIPLTPTAAFPGALLPWLDAGGAARRVGHALSRQLIWTTTRTATEAVRREVLGAAPSPRLAPRAAGLVAGPVLYGYSEAFLPRDPSWGDQVEVVGFWYADEPPGWAPPPELAEFLAAGPPPVCLGFGSMSSRDPKATTQLVLEAVKRAGVRAVVQAGWAGLGGVEVPPEVLLLEGVPHAWLYPRCRAVVHHGGAGTTAAALRAGVPAVVVPFHGDQPFWASRVHAAGVGVRPLPRKGLTAARLAQALREATSDESLREKAAALGARLRAEDGVGRTVAALERLARRG